MAGALGQLEVASEIWLGTGPSRRVPIWVDKVRWVRQLRMLVVPPRADEMLNGHAGIIVRAAIHVGGTRYLAGVPSAGLARKS